MRLKSHHQQNQNPEPATANSVIFTTR